MDETVIILGPNLLTHPASTFLWRPVFTLMTFKAAETELAVCKKLVYNVFMPLNSAFSALMMVDTCYVLQKKHRILV
ncbi:hypothetical protein [Klebsiella quasipneumoniae]|uniref:hypothetical protein n=1 Tax=Klebsiella quasipneumoniae TaxID=1463165 RepID=UPI003F1C9CCC